MSCAQKSTFNYQHLIVATLNWRAFKIRHSIVGAQLSALNSWRSKVAAVNFRRSYVLRLYIGTQLSCAQKSALKCSHLKSLCSSVDAEKLPYSSVERWSQRSNFLCSKYAGLDCRAFNCRRSDVLRSTVGPQISCAQNFVQRCLEDVRDNSWFNWFNDFLTIIINEC